MICLRADASWRFRFAAVRLFGFGWSRISAVLGVSANACKKRWSLFRSSYLPLSHLLHPLPPVASFPVVGVSFPLVVPCGRGLQRSTSGGRNLLFEQSSMLVVGHRSGHV